MGRVGALECRICIAYDGVPQTRGPGPSAAGAGEVGRGTGTRDRGGTETYWIQGTISQANGRFGLSKRHGSSQLENVPGSVIRFQVPDPHRSAPDTAGPETRPAGPQRCKRLVQERVAIHPKLRILQRVPEQRAPPGDLGRRFRHRRDRGGHPARPRRTQRPGPIQPPRSPAPARLVPADARPPRPGGALRNGTPGHR